MSFRWNSELQIFGESLFEIKQNVSHLSALLDDQWPSIGYMIGSIVNRRITGAGEDRSRLAFKHLAYPLKNQLGYDGTVRPCIRIYGEDPTLSSYNPRIDVGLLVSGRSFTRDAVDLAKILRQDQVETFILTYASKEAIEQARKAGKVKKSDESALDFLKYPDSKHIINLPARRDTEPLARTVSNVSPEATRFETSAAVLSKGIADCIKDYHLRYDGSKTIPTKTVARTIDSFESYFGNCLIPFCNKNQEQLIAILQEIEKANHIRIPVAGEGDILGRWFIMRGEHLGFDGIKKSIQVIDSANYGTPGSSNIRKEDLVLGISMGGTSGHTKNVMEEAMKKEVVKRIFITSNPYSNEISRYATSTLVMPHTVPGYYGEFAHLGFQIILDACISQVANDMGIKNG